MRRRAVVLLDEEDLFRLLHLTDGERVISVVAKWELGAIGILIEGPNLPESVEGTKYPRIQRPLAMAVLRKQLFELFAAYRAGDYADEAGARRFADKVREAIEAEVGPHAR